MNRSPDPMSAASWRYAYAYVLSTVLGGIAIAWGLFLWASPSAFTLNVTWGHLRDHQYGIAATVVTLGVIQALMAGPIARGMTTAPTLLAAFWTLIMISLVSVDWRTTGTSVYGSLAVCQWGVVVLSSYDSLRDTVGNVREAARRMTRGRA